MCRFDEAIEETDCSRLDAHLAEFAGLCTHRVFVKCVFYRAVKKQPLLYLKPPIARHQRHRFVCLQIVEVWACLAAKVEQVTKSVIGDQPGLGALALNKRVGCYGRTVPEKDDLHVAATELRNRFSRAFCDRL